MENKKFFVALAAVFGILLRGCGSISDQPEASAIGQPADRMEATSSSSSGKNQSQQLNQAIKDLENQDKIVRRQAAEKIYFLINTPGIQRAIKPLSDVLLNRGIRSGIFTQEIAATNLGRIAAHLAGPQGNHAMEALIESLGADDFDSIRAASANALGLTNNELAVAPLQDALANDPSPLVKFAAQDALNRLARSGVPIPLNLKTLSLKLSGPASGDSALRKYLKRMVIYSNPPLDSEEGQ